MVTALFCYTLYTLVLSILISLVYVKTNGNTFSSILIHNMGNLSLGTVQLIFTKTGAAVLLTALIGIGVGVLWRFKDTMFTSKIEAKTVRIV